MKIVNMPYYGGKASKSGDWILDKISRIPHKIYVEPFGGMGTLLLNKKPSVVEVYNDLDSEIYNYMEVLQSPALRRELVDLLRFVPYSREKYLASFDSLGEGSQVYRAAKVVICLLMGLSPNIIRRTGFSNGGANYQTSVARSFRNKVRNMDIIGDRLGTVILENRDAEKLIMEWGCNDSVLIYLDPPYINSTGYINTDYRHKYKLMDHVRLVDLVLTLPCKVVISNYANTEYDRLEAAGWIRLEFATFSSMGAVSKFSKMPRTECLWVNPAAAIHLQQTNLFGMKVG